MIRITNKLHRANIFIKILQKKDGKHMKKKIVLSLIVSLSLVGSSITSFASNNMNFQNTQQMQEQL